MSRPGKTVKNPLEAPQTIRPSFESLPKENHPIFPSQDLRKIQEKQEDFTKTGLTKKQKVTELYYNAKDPIAEIYTHNSNLKKRLRNYADHHPDFCRLTDDDGHGIRFEIDKHSISIHLTAPYTEARRKATSELAKRTALKRSGI